MVEKLKVGDTIPQFECRDHKGFTVTKEALIGTTTVIFFYPKDETPGCTKEVCAFRDDMSQFDYLATLIIGVSPDSIESHKQFLEKNKLEYTLLSDEDRKMCDAFGVLEGEKVVRSTFLIDAKSIIQWIEKPVNVEGHVARVLEAIKKYCPHSVVKFDTFNQDYAEYLQGGFKLPETQEQIKERIKKQYNIRDSDLDSKKKKK